MIRLNNNSNRSKYINNLFSRVLISIIVVLSSVIFVKRSNNNLLLYKEQVFEKSFKFSTVNKWYKKYLGSILPFDKVVNDDTKMVFNETFKYKDKSKNLDGTKFIVNDKYLMPALQSGIVVFMGNKEGYGNTIIIQGSDGIDIWYTNLNSTLKLYDYVEKNTLVGECNDNQLTLVFQKDNNYIDFKEYETNNKN